jgi:spore germination protein YaaH
VLAPAHSAFAAASLSLGASGASVTALQQKLITKGYLASGKATGYFGPLTDAALKKFQCDAGVICSGNAVAGYGVYGPRTQAAMGGTVSSGSGTGTATAKLEYSGWLPYWKEASSTQDALAHIDQLTEINPFVYVLQSDGTIRDMVGIADEPWRSLITVAKAKKVRVIPTIMTSDTGALHDILSNSARRIQLEDDIAALVVNEGFDGIDIDFEGKRAEDRDYFSTFLRGLYQRMGKKWVMCTIESRTPLADRYYGATQPADAGMYSNDFVQINKYCDRVRFMTYDQQTIDLKQAALADANKQLYAPVADTVWVEKAIREAMKTIDKKKIVIGVATYGYEWDVTAYADGYVYDLLWSFGPGYAAPIAAQYGVTPTRQASGEMGFSYTPAAGITSAPTANSDVSTSATTSGNTAELALAAAQANNTHSTFRYMVWQDAQAIKDKIDLAKRLGVRGVAVFRLDGGEDAAMWQYFK